MGTANIAQPVQGLNFNAAFEFFGQFALGHMSQTGPKKCFIPQNCEKYTNFDSTGHSL